MSKKYRLTLLSISLVLLLIRQYTINSSEFNALLWYWIIFMILNVPSIANSIELAFEKKVCNPNEEE